MVMKSGYKMLETTAEVYFSSPPDDMEDAYVIKHGVLREVWDVGCEKTPDGQIYLYGTWPAEHIVPPNEPIYYSPPERWE